MDPRKNPYTAGAGVRPFEIAGRDAAVSKVDIALDRRLAGNHATDILLVGLRGVGKTVLLNSFVAMAKQKGCQTIRIELQDGSGEQLARKLVPELNIVLRRLDQVRAAGHGLKQAAAALQNFASVFRIKYEGISVGAEPVRAPAVGELETDLPELLCSVARAAQSRKTCIGLFLDEVQNLSQPELSALSRACHAAAQEKLPILLIGAGLPQVAAAVGDLKTYAERQFTFIDLGPLDPEAACRVLTAPAKKLGVTYLSDALTLILDKSGGYPFFLQIWGQFAWDEAKDPVIDRSVISRIEPDVLNYLDQNIFRVRFDRCTPLEQEYLRGMAELGPGPHATGDIAKALGTGSAKLAAVRRSLIAAGLIYSQRHGETAFTVPMFDAFMRRAMPELVPYATRKPR